MRQVWLTALAICAAGTPVVAQQARMRPPARLKVAAQDTAFPAYSREDQTKTCLYSYGIENSSILDCVAQDQKIKASLSERWAHIADDLKKDCTERLAQRHLGSYLALDRCIQSLRDSAAKPD